MQFIYNVINSNVLLVMQMYVLCIYVIDVSKID